MPSGYPVYRLANHRDTFQDQVPGTQTKRAIVSMTREELLTRIRDLQTQLDSEKADPRQSYSETLAISAPILRELMSLQEELKRLDSRR